MGTFRLMLAVTVMLGHLSLCYANALPYFVTGGASVPAFYIVSGFLMTLVLTEKYSGKVALFYSNRALRIFPNYWAALAIYLVANWLSVMGYLPQRAAPDLADYRIVSALWYIDQPGHELGYLSKLILVLSNLFIFGQGAFIYLGRWPNVTHLSGFYHGFFFVPQAWTVAVELAFYLIAPFVVTRLRVVIGVLLLSLAARGITALTIWPHAIDDYSIFPFELAFFMAGSLAYRAYVRLCSNAAPWVSVYSIASCAGVLALTFFYLSLPQPPGRWIYLFAVAFCLPGIVLVGRKNPFDKVLGDFSYPIYLMHMALMVVYVPGETVWVEIAAIALVIAICAIVLYIVEWPLDRLRQRRALGPATAIPLIAED